MAQYQNWSPIEISRCLYTPRWKSWRRSPQSKSSNRQFWDLIRSHKTLFSPVWTDYVQNMHNRKHAWAALKIFPPLRPSTPLPLHVLPFILYQPLSNWFRQQYLIITAMSHRPLRCLHFPNFSLPQLCEWWIGSRTSPVGDVYRLF